MTDIISKQEGYFLIADLSGYTAMTEAHGPSAAARVVTRFVEIVKASLVGDCRLVERVGDEVVVLSHLADSILRTAFNLLEKSEEQESFPRVHIGVHFGTYLEDEGHYFGSVINVTSRIASYAHGGQLLCSADAITGIDLDSGIQPKEVGKVKFKNIKDEVTLYEIGSGYLQEAVKAMDPVCRMKIDITRALASAVFDDQRYYFCSLECARQFLAAPGEYLSEGTH